MARTHDDRNPNGGRRVQQLPATVYDLNRKNDTTKYKYSAVIGGGGVVWMQPQFCLLIVLFVYIMFIVV